jgi:mannose-6-phosphate isomerase-like protein (cupin superfamily)
LLLTYSLYVTYKEYVTGLLFAVWLKLLKEGHMSNFHSLPEIVRAMATKAAQSTSAAPVKPLARGEFMGAAVVRGDGGLHRQPDHEELLVVLDGEGDFRVADEVRHIRPGDFVFVPRNAIHGAVATQNGPIALLAIIAPKFDLAKDVVWEKGAELPRFEMV